jgi:hypothetical protein
MQVVFLKFNGLRIKSMKREGLKLVGWLGVICIAWWILHVCFLVPENENLSDGIPFEKPWLSVAQKSHLLDEQCEFMNSAALFLPDMDRQASLRSPVSGFYSMMLEPEPLIISIEARDFFINEPEGLGAISVGLSPGAFEWQWIGASGKPMRFSANKDTVFMKWRSLTNEASSGGECVDISGAPDVWEGAVFETFCAKEGQWSQPFCVKSSGAAQWDSLLVQKIKQKTQSWLKPFAYYRFEFTP